VPQQQGTAFVGLRLDPPTQGAGRCLDVPPRPKSKKGKIRLTKSAVRVQQVIDAEALRRVNAVNAWIDAGIDARDLCSSGFGMRAFSPNVSWAGGPTADAAGLPDPRPLEVVRRRKPPADFTVDRAALVTNERISLALEARVRATWKRLNRLTGGNLARSSDLRGRPLYDGLALAGPVPVSEDAPPAKLEIGPVKRVGKLPVTVATARRTQKRSQGAILLANRIIDEIRGGLEEEHFRPGSIGSRHLT
jgi:hypothetical protein